jgi:hypothetical protein
VWQNRNVAVKSKVMPEMPVMKVDVYIPMDKDVAARIKMMLGTMKSRTENWRSKNVGLGMTNTTMVKASDRPAVKVVVSVPIVGGGRKSQQQH